MAAALDWRPLRHAVVDASRRATRGVAIDSAGKQRTATSSERLRNTRFTVRDNSWRCLLLVAYNWIDINNITYT